MIHRAALLFVSFLFFSACAAQPAAPDSTGENGSVQNFIVMLEGRNFVFDHEGQPTRFGFSTTRNVVARNALEAEEIAIRGVRNDETLSRSLLNTPEDPPRVTATRHVAVESFEAVPMPDLGYIFYRDHDSD